PWRRAVADAAGPTTQPAQVAGMAEVISASRASAAADAADELSEVCLEVGHGSARPTLYAVADAGFLIGTVPGCDLRVPGADWPAVLALVARCRGGASVRKLSPTQPVFVNGQAVASAVLVHGDRVKVGPVEMVVRLQPATATPPKPPPAARASAPALDAAR